MISTQPTNTILSTSMVSFQFRFNIISISFQSISISFQFKFQFDFISIRFISFQPPFILTFILILIEMYHFNIISISFQYHFNIVSISFQLKFQCDFISFRFISFQPPFILLNTMSGSQLVIYKLQNRNVKVYYLVKVYYRYLHHFIFEISITPSYLIITIKWKIFNINSYKRTFTCT